MAGLFGFNNYEKVGKGVSKDSVPKRSIFLFFELFFRKFSKIVALNFIYLAFIIPTAIVVLLISGIFSSQAINIASPAIADIFNLAQETAVNHQNYIQMSIYIDVIIRVLITVLFAVLWGMGPATCGLTYILRNYARQEHSWLISDFFQKTKNNFKQGLVVWLIDVAAMFVLWIAYNFYATQTGFLSVLRYLILSITIVYTMMHFYIYQIMITFELSLKKIYRNSLILALGKLPRNLLILISLLFICLTVPYISIVSSSFGLWVLVFIVLLLFILFSFSGFLINFFVYPVIKKEMLSKVDPEKYSKF